MEEKEYIVTLHNKQDLDQFYIDMEELCLKDNIPNREVECLNRRLISRNTHYSLTDAEAIELRKDPRVLAVELTPEALGVKIETCYTITSNNWDKSWNTVNTHKNWGLLRCVEGKVTNTWGQSNIPNRSATNYITSSGKNVDVVIVDGGHFYKDHPEYAKNPDGTGGTRSIEYNWYQHNPTVLGTAAGTYSYSSLVDHSAHVAGTVAGNTQGWAIDANIYSMSFNTASIFDYIRAFHDSKAVNPVTKVKNPTIVNNSWGANYSVASYTDILSVTYRGTTHTAPLTKTQLESYGVVINSDNSVIVGYRNPALEADILDAYNDGIIIVGAAGNYCAKIDIPGGLDYNNTMNFMISGNLVTNAPYHRGSSPASATGCITVGAIENEANDQKAAYSHTGPRIDIYAPGTAIMSAVNTNAVFATAGVSDPRNASYYLNKYQGTSMATPQVTGMLACVLEQYPRMTPAEALEYLIYYSEKNVITTTSGGYTDHYDILGSANRYLHYNKERPDHGAAYPKVNYRIRPTSGAVYPRPKRKG